MVLDRNEQRTCYNCNQVGHLSRNCPHPQRRQQQVRALYSPHDSSYISSFPSQSFSPSPSYYSPTPPMPSTSYSSPPSNDSEQRENEIALLRDQTETLKKEIASLRLLALKE
jgi:hypothetical protein